LASWKRRCNVRVNNPPVRVVEIAPAAALYHGLNLSTPPKKSAPMNVLEFNDAAIKVGSRIVLSDLNIVIKPGEFIGVLGPNGAGKTTLMRTVLGLIVPCAGRVRVLGTTPQRGNPAIGYVPQLRSIRTDLRMRGLDFIGSSLHGERWGLPLLSRADRGLIEETLSSVGASELAGRPLSEMSGGERQLLLLAQALLGTPRLLLLDEPLISLDPRRQEAVIALVRRLSRERGITVMFSAHELNQLLGVLDRVLYLGGGLAVAGTVKEVVTAPVLSRLYGTEINVIHAGAHIFIVAHGRDIERDDHQHDDGHHRHA
jgi:zinc/manganese transport system ATP-binding protein